MRDLLFIHGAGNDGSVWTNIEKRLSKKYKIYTPNLPGHAGEKGLCKSIEEYAEWIADYTEKLNLFDVVLIGHSMGGAISIKASKNNRVASLIVVGSGLKLPVSSKILTGLKNDLDRTVEMIAKWSFSKKALDSLKIEAMDMMLKNGNIILNDFEACNNYQGYQDVKEIKIPSLVVVGDSDVMTPINLANEAGKYLGCRIMIIENAGHMVQLENPNALADAIEDFIAHS